MLCVAASGDPQRKGLAVVGMESGRYSRIHGSRNFEAARVIRALLKTAPKSIELGGYRRIRVMGHPMFWRASIKAMKTSRAIFSQHVR